MVIMPYLTPQQYRTTYESGVLQACNKELNGSSQGLINDYKPRFAFPKKCPYKVALEQQVLTVLSASGVTGRGFSAMRLASPSAFSMGTRGKIAKVRNPKTN